MAAKEILGHYELGKSLGSGSFASVRECTDLNTGHKWAIKILDKKMLVDQNMGVQVQREIAVMLKMKHRNIVEMKECFQTADKVYIILELVDGGELFDKIKVAKKLDEETARTYFQQLILGLHYCHKNNITHRDLKPENLLLNKDNIVKISDFGLANTQKATDSGRVSASLMLKTVCGTPNYVAPEVLMESGYNGFHADMWSSGVILYVMLCGKLPFYDKNMATLFKKIQTGQYDLPAYLSDGSKSLIKKLMCVDTKERYSTQLVIEDPWFKVGFKEELLKDGSEIAAPTEGEISKAFGAMKTTADLSKK
jgi:5'-AMP-activated protein kinase catalytic alpha subunit